jgi:CDP-glycerol glycerophosphotransferase
VVSVVIPVYDVEAYLGACLDSVLGPAGGGLAGRVEVIAVDDASPDGCGELLDARAAGDSRLRVVHLAENGGPGHARNVGLGLAAAEYVWFVDGDDQVADGALDAIGARLAGAGRPDVVLVDWVSRYPDGRAEANPGRELVAGVPGGGCTLAEEPRLLELTMTSWSKVLRREFLERLGAVFSTGIHEDIFVTCALLLAAESIVAVPEVCYRYRRDRVGSFMATSGPGHLAVFESYERVFALVAAQLAAGAQVSAAVQAAIFSRAIWHYTTVFDAAGVRGAGGLVPAAERRAFFSRMQADFRRYRPPGYRYPGGARGIKFRLVERGAYHAYLLLEPLNDARVAGAKLAARRSVRPA